MELIIVWFIKLNGLFTDNYEVSGVEQNTVYVNRWLDQKHVNK